MVILSLVETVVRSCLCKFQHGRQGASVCCFSAALLLVAMVVRACLYKVRYGRWDTPMCGRVVVGCDGGEIFSIQGSVW